MHRTLQIGGTHMKMILFPSCMVMLGVFGMIWSAVVLVRHERFFTSAAGEIQAAI